MSKKKLGITKQISNLKVSYKLTYTYLSMKYIVRLNINEIFRIQDLNGNTYFYAPWVQITQSCKIVCVRTAQQKKVNGLKTSK